MKQKSVIVIIAAVVAVICLGISLFILCDKGYPVEISTRVVSDLPSGVTAELSQVTKDGGVLTLTLSEKQSEHDYYVMLNNPLEVFVEQQTENGQWISIAETKIPLYYRGDFPPVHLKEGETVIDVTWKQQYGSLPSGTYRLIFWLCSNVDRIEKWVSVPFTIG